MNREEHPGNSSLLACLRGQRLEDQERIDLHLMGCSQCQQTYADLSQSSKPLDVLNQMSRYERYPELSPVLILRQAQDNALKRSIWSDLERRTVSRPRPKRTAVRLVSLPAALVLVLLFMTVVIVLAYTFTHFLQVPSHWSLPWGIHSSQPNEASVAQHQPTLSPTSVVRPTSTTGPNIVVCSTTADIKNFRLVICGSNFKQGDRVRLVEILLGGKLIPLRIIKSVDADGKFTTHPVIISCESMPQAIIAEDISSKTPVSATLSIDPTTWSCSGPGPQ
jgi:hypothetical protein